MKSPRRCLSERAARFRRNMTVIGMTFQRVLELARRTSHQGSSSVKWTLRRVFWTRRSACREIPADAASEMMAITFCVAVPGRGCSQSRDCASHQRKIQADMARQSRVTRQGARRRYALLERDMPWHVPVA